MHPASLALPAFKDDAVWLFVAEEHWIIAALNCQKDSAADNSGDDKKFGEVFHGL